MVVVEKPDYLTGFEKDEAKKQELKEGENLMYHWR